MTRIIQLLPVLSFGDAIGGATLATDTILREAGYDTEIWADVVDPLLYHRASEVVNQGLVVPGDDDVVIYRLSIGSRLAPFFLQLPGKKIVVFHNITPASYFEKVSPRVTHWLRRGYEDLAAVVPAADLVVADSLHNLTVAQAAGAVRGAVIPPSVDLTRLGERAMSRPVDVENAEVAFVGRVAPNKRHEILLYALAVARAGRLPEMRLTCAGSAVDCEPYLLALQSLSRQLDLEDCVELTGARVSDDYVGSLYRRATIFATASEHEGFCVPVVEAMYHGLPIVAAATTAIPETTDDAALLMDSTDPLEWGEALTRLTFDAGLRRRLVKSGHRRLEHFSPTRIARLWRETVATL